MDITPNHVRALVNNQLDYLRNSDNSVRFGSLGPLAVIVADQAGWRADGTARTHAFLEQLLARYESAEKRSPRNIPNTLVAKAIRRHWGVNEYPVSLEVIRSEWPSGADITTPGLSSMHEWPDRVFESEAVLTWLRTVWWPEHGTAVPRQPKGPRQYWTGDKSEWPPDERWPDLLLGANEREALVKSARSTLGDAAPDTDEEVLWALREVVGEHLHSVYFDHGENSNTFRHLLHRVIIPWNSNNAFGLRFFEDQDDDVDAGHYSKTVAAAAQMFFHDVANGLTDDLGKRLFVVVTANEASQQISAMATRGRAGSSGSFSARSTGNRISRSLILAGGKKLDLAGIVSIAASQSDATEALALANVIRGTTSKIARAQLCETYMVIRRPLKFENLNSADVVMLVLADQSAHLDMVYLKLEDLVRELGELIEDASPGQAEGAYRALIHRNDSLIHTKNFRHREAVTSIHEGFKHLEWLRDHGFIEDRAARESAHQLALAGAGVYIRVVEVQLRERALPGPDVRLYENARNALFLSSETGTRLSELEAEGLPGKRHDDQHISAVSWRVQSRIIRLRTQLAIRTAVQSKLTNPITRDKWHDNEIYDVELVQLCNSYTRLVETQELQLANRVEVVQFALWLAFLNKGNIPVVRDLAPALKELHFIDSDPASITRHGVNHRVLDVESATLWLEGQGANAGILSALPATGPVVDHLTQSSGGVFTNWREQFPPPPAGRRH